MGVIPLKRKTYEITGELFPRYGGYSVSYADDQLKFTVVSPLWGLFFSEGRSWKNDNSSCFPVMGVILYLTNKL